MPNQLPSKSDQDKRDRELAKQLKSKLRKFVTDTQVHREEQTAKQLEGEKQEQPKADDVIEQAVKLSATPFIEDRFWKKGLPAVSKPWLR